MLNIPYEIYIFLLIISKYFLSKIACANKTGVLELQSDMVKSHTHSFSGSTNGSNATGSIYPIATYRNGVESQSGCLSGTVNFSDGDFVEVVDMEVSMQLLTLAIHIAIRVVVQPTVTTAVPPRTVL